MKNKKENINVIVSFIIVIALIILVVISLLNKPAKTENVDDNLGNINMQDDQITNNNTGEQASPSEKPMEPNTNARSLSNFTPIAKVSTLEKIDTVVGTGALVKAGDTVSVNYTGAVASTGVIFQSSKDFGSDPVTFPLSGVIKGWTDGIPGMKVGGTRRLIIPAEEAYGANPPQGSGIPTNADLVFDVELVSIQ